MTVEFAAAREVDLPAIARLAHEIWYEYYVPIIGKAQVDYMVARFQSAAAMREQLASGYEYFILRQPAAADSPAAPCASLLPMVGYIAVQPGPEVGQLFIGKLYLHRNSRGRGTGRAAMEFIENLARKRGLSLLWLTVNKGNPAVQAYQRMGFRNAGAVVMDIGGGFVMDDYRMEKSLDSCPP